MNKYQAALNNVKIAPSFMGGNDEYRRHLDSSVPFLKDIAILQELVDKETPMKPIANKLPYEVHDGEIVTKYYEYNCPKCNVVLTKKWRHVYIRADKYCPNCGQKLDWSD